jgi:outer membrane protein assembly factor BamB
MTEQLNSLAQAWWAWMGPMFWQMGVLVLVIGAVDVLLRRHLWPQLRYALWLLILVKLVMPPSFSLSTGLVSQLRAHMDQKGSQLDTADAATGLSSYGPALEVSAHGAAIEPLTPRPLENLSTDPRPELAGLADLTRPHNQTKLSWQAYAMAAWLIGIGALSGWLIVRLRRLRHVYKDRPRCMDLPAWFGPLLAETAQTLRLSRPPEIVLSRDIPSPAVFGTFRPVLVLPEAAIGRLSRKCTKHILLHELAHIKRGDLLINSLYTLLQIAYWFNPLVWLLRRRLQHLRELCCDATVAGILRERTSEYRETILESARRLFVTPVAPGIGLLGLFESSSRLRIRLKWLEKKTWTYRGLRVVTVLLLVMGMCVFVLPMAKARQSAAAPALDENWPCFRGLGGAGVSTATDIPTHWDGPSGAGILWKSPVPLAGNNSPIVWQDRVFMSGAKDNALEVYCFDSSSGQRLWTGTVPMSRPAPGEDFEVMDDTGLAAPTMVTNGKHVCAVFATGDMACFDFQGQRLWTRGLGIPDSVYGYASSLAVYRNLAIVQYDQAGPEDGKSELLALDMASGNIIWRTKRPVANSWTSPIVTKIEGRDTIVTCADPWVIAYDPATGAEIWRIDCVGGDLAASPLCANGRVFVIEPYSSLIAIDPNGRGELSEVHQLWINEDSGPDICSPVSDGEMIYLLDTAGLLSCCRTSDGTTVWEQDLKWAFFASPSLVNNRLYLLDDKGTMSIAQVGSEFKLLGKSALGEKCSASPAFANGRIYIRGEKHLFCIGSADNIPQELASTDQPAETTRRFAITDSSDRNAGHLARFNGRPADLPGAWPGFRGVHSDNVSRDYVPLTRQWPAEGPKVIWSRDVGEGFAGAALRDGRVYLMDYDREKQADAIRCFSLADGTEIWRHSYPVKIKRWHGMSRTVPALTDEYVVTIGPKCHVTCVHADTGEFNWMLDLVQQYNTKIPQWYTAQCPLIDEGRAIIAPGADDVLMMAVDCVSGEILWTTPNPDKWVMTHSSIVPMTFAGERFYIYCGGSTSHGGVVGVSARDGRVLWKNEQWRVRVNVPTPVVVGPDRIFVSAGYAQTKYGCAMLRLVSDRGQIQAKLDFMHPTTVFGSMQQTPILYQGHLYGVGMDRQLTCLDLDGQVVWTSTRANKFGFGPYMIADSKIYVMDDAGVLTMIEATPAGYRPLARAELFADGIESWGPMAMASGRLILRDLTRMICVDMTQATKTANLSNKPGATLKLQSAP